MASRLPFAASTLFIVLALAGGQACNKAPLTAPSGTAITLIATATTVAVNGGTDITAVLIEGGLSAGQNGGTVTSGAGTPVHNGTKVFFSTTIGRVEPAEAETKDGRVTVRLVADGRSGVATITAISGPASQTLEVTIGGAAASRIAVTAEPQQLAANGGTTTIRARVEDENGNGVPGVTVTFSTTAGSLASTGAVTNADGVATTTLTTPGAATVTASAGAGNLTATVGVTVSTRTTLSITPPASATVSVPASFTLVVGTTVSGQTGVLDDVVVRFGDGGQVSLGTVSQGVAATFGYLFGESGVQSVTATGRDPQGNIVTASTQVAVAPLVANGSVSPAAVALGNPQTFTVTVTPANAAIERYIWDMGEGDGPVTTASNQRTHVFRQRGTKTVTVTVVPTKGPTITVLIVCDVN
jgi:adhesin/invasin